MSQVIIRNLDERIVGLLKARAARAGQSLEQSLRDLLEREARRTRDDLLEDLEAIRAQIPARRSPPFAEDLIREDRDGR